MINPIETKYKGIKFRSRLEARWAVFINALGFNFVYEPDAYNLNGIYYLPDFWIPDWKAFIEIKPTSPTEEEKEKCDLLSKLTKNQVLLITGQPWIDEYQVFWFNKIKDNISHEQSDKYDDLMFDRELTFAEDRKEERVIWLVSEGGCASSFYVPSDPSPKWGDKYPLTQEWAESILKAFEVARQERFGT